MKKHLLATFIGASLLCAATANAAVITPVNRDSAGQGLNDPTAAAPVGGNPGTSVGEQRRIVYQFAADLWGAVLQSNVPTRVAASFQPLTCTASSGVLGSAGAWYVNRGFTNVPVPGIWYHAAVANSIAGTNLNSADPGYVFPDDIEISSRFNSNLGTPGCLEASGWYYGLDGNTPAGRINFLDVVMHEIGHGLGFQGFLDKTTGALFDADGAGTAEFPRSDTYTQFAYDNVENKRFGDPTMTNALRATAMSTPGRLAWDGPEVTANAPDALDPLQRLRVTGDITANYDYGTAAFGPAATVANFNGDVVLANDGSATPTQGCVASPAGAYTGKVVIIDRGTCSFEIKTVNAQNAGATEVIIANNAAGVIGMAEDATVVATIPAVMVSQADGNAIKAELPGVNAEIFVIPGQLAGSDPSGRALLYAPVTVAPGSTFSHYDISHSPNALMEPSINSDLDGNFRVDLTPSLYQDIGWTLNSGNARLRGGTCDSGVPVQTPGLPGLIVGANLQASDKMCRATTAGNGSKYRSCMKDALEAAGIELTGRVRACTTK